MIETKERINQLLKAINATPWELRGHLANHNLYSVFNPIQGIVLEHKEKRAPTPHDDILDNPSGMRLTPQMERWRLMHKLESCKKRLEYARRIPPAEIVEEERRRFLETLPDTALIFPILESEILLLARPTIENYDRLVSQRIAINAILRRFGVETLSEDREVDGSVGITLINVAGNANKYRYPGTKVRTRWVSPDEVEMQNYCEYSLPDDLYNLGIIGPCGNRGMGLHLVDLLNRAKGAKTSYECKKAYTEHGMINDIRFTIPTAA